MLHPGHIPLWSWLLPLIGLVLAIAALAIGNDGPWGPLQVALAIALMLALLAAVFAAVHHAEIIAERTGEPYGTLVLTIVVTVIELSLIVSVMLTGKANPYLVRDTVYSVVMIVCNGLVGLCILMGCIRYKEQSYDISGASIYLAVLIVFAVLTLILPNYATSLPGPVYSNSQLAFISMATIALYAVFLYTQTIGHRDYFMPRNQLVPAEHAIIPPGIAALSVGLLVLSVTTVVLIAKTFASVMDVALQSSGAPPAVAGVIIALVILLPEGVAALRSARQDQLQKSLNLALGSSLATIGLTIPAIALVNLITRQELVLGLDNKEIVLLSMTFAASILTFGTGRTNILYGFLHLVIFGTFLFLTIVP
jgi:Ca2+:H+ antiporter